MQIDLSPCTGEEWDILTAFVAAFCAEDGHAHGPRNEATLRELMANPALGRALMIRRDRVPAGYVVLCYGFSLEFHGRDAFIDEFYVAPEHRGHGIGAQVLDLLEEVARADGVKALHLEVMDGNESATRLYTRHGFETRKSRLMTKRLVRASDQ